MPIDEWKGKQNVAYAYNGIQLSFKKEGDPVTYYSMGES